MRQSDLRTDNAVEIVTLLRDLTRGDGNRVEIGHNVIVMRMGKPTLYLTNHSLVECLRAAKADEPAAPQE